MVVFAVLHGSSDPRISRALAPRQLARDRATPSDTFKRPALAANIGEIVRQMDVNSLFPFRSLRCT
eukprot:3243430-Pyramimonas_sp.AAC.1